MVTPSGDWARLASALGARAVLDKPIGPLTTYGVGGPAALYVEIEGPEDLAVVRRVCREHVASSGTSALPVFVLGRGSNLLVADEGFEGMVLHLGAGFAGIDLPVRGRGRFGQPARGRAGGRRRGAPGARPPCRRRGMERALLGRRRAGLGRRGRSHERRRSRLGHGVVSRPLQLGRSLRRRRRHRRRRSPRLRLPLLRGGGLPCRPGGGAVRHAGRGRTGAGGGERHRQVAPRAPARRFQCRLGLHQP